MTWTYGGDPSANDRDAVRFLSGDTDTSNQQVSDEEIAFLLTESNDNVYLSAAGVCDAAAARVSAKADESKSVGDLSLSTSYANQAATFQERALNLRAESVRKTPPVPKFYLTDTDPRYVFGKEQFSIGMDTNK